MTNEQRFKTPEERAGAFRRFCALKRCDECECEKQEKKGISLCEFTWLTLEAEEKLLPCPFCGSANTKIMPTVSGNYVATCDKCFAASGAEVTKADAIAAWNRRVK